MQLLSFFTLLLGAASSVAQAAAGVDGADTRTAAIYIQPVVPQASGASAPAPALLAQIRYDARDRSVPPEVDYEAPEDLSDSESDDDALYRIGVYDPKAGRWLSATSVVAAANFAKGYRPHFVLTTAAGAGTPLATSLRGLPIDAGATRDFAPQASVVQAAQGATRDFAPQASVVQAAQGATPVLNRPVVLSPEGKKVAPPEEKTFLQKYWWAIGIAVMILATGGGGEPEK